jgi:transcriptional regulator with XRE-family HTH domain
LAIRRPRHSPSVVGPPGGALGGKVDGDEWMVMIVASATLATPTEIGARVRSFRNKRALDLEVVAGLAGISKSYLARLERGERHFNRRGLLEAVAAAIGCSVLDLTDPDADPEQAAASLAAEAVIEEIRTALMDCTLDDVPDMPTRPVRELVTTARLANERRLEAGDFDLAERGFGALLTELQVAAATTKDGVERQVVLAALVEAFMMACEMAYTFGHPMLALLVAERERDAAARLGDPGLIGFADWTRARALDFAGAHRLADNALTEMIDSLAGVDPTGTYTLTAEAYGFAHLRRALHAARSGRGDTAHEHLGEAGRIASLTGECNGLHQHFGPSNVAIWRLSIGVELQEAGRAYERAMAASIDPARLGTSRTGAMHFDLARALAQEGSRRRDADALRHLDLADQNDPQRMRNLPVALELLDELDKRAPQKSWLLKSLKNRFRFKR